MPAEQEEIAPQPVVTWRPQPGPQTALVHCVRPEIFFGGARGGGKTDGVLGKWAIKERQYGARFNGLALRRSAVSFADAIERSREIYRPLGGHFNEQKLVWRMPNGGRVSFAYLENVRDANEYQGRNVTDAWVEEAGLFPDPAPIDRLFGMLRSSSGVPVQLILTANPGGAGQHWIRSRYGLVPFPRQPKAMERPIRDQAGKEIGKHKIAVIPSRITDNRILLARDPGYPDRLRLSGSAQLVKAWLEGDWSAIEAAYFDCWSEAKHVIEPFSVPQEWTRFRSGDWGSASPFCFGWYAVVQDDYPLMGRTIRRGALIKYREWYGSTDPGSGAKGLKLTAEQMGEGIAARERGERVAYGVLDPRTFAVESGPSIAERINAVLIKNRTAVFREADNKRVPRGLDASQGRGPLSGWNEMRQRLEGIEGNPMLLFFSTCVASIRTIPALQHDPARAEDVDTTGEDHAADETRYACMSRPWLNKLKIPDAVEDAYRDSQEMSVARDSIKLL
jgi:hypothetical protein